MSESVLILNVTLTFTYLNTSHGYNTAGKIDCNTESSYKKFQACLITYNKVVIVFCIDALGLLGGCHFGLLEQRYVTSSTHIVEELRQCLHGNVLLFLMQGY